MNKQRSVVISIISILVILGGILGIVHSFPLLELSQSIRQGEMVVKDEVRVVEVYPNTPADQAGIQVGDIITSVDGKEVQASADFIRVVNEKAGENVRLTLRRSGKTISLSIEPQQHPPSGQGRVGIMLTDSKAKKAPLYQLIPQVIISGYTGNGVVLSPLSHKMAQARLRLLLTSIMYISIGAGLWYRKKWALYGFILLAIYSVAVSLPTVIDLFQTPPPINPPFRTNTFDKIIAIAKLLFDPFLAILLMVKRTEFS